MAVRLHSSIAARWRRQRGPGDDVTCTVRGRMLDFIIGDPPRWPHPVRWIGNPNT